MSNNLPEEEFTLEDILREFGSGADDLPPEPVLPGMAQVLPELPEVAEESAPEEAPEETAEAPKKERRKKAAEKKRQPAAQAPENLYEDDFFALEGEEEDYSFTLQPTRQEKKKKQPKKEKLPQAPKQPRSAGEILAAAEKREQSLDLRLRICLVVTVVNLLLALYNALELHWIRGFENVVALGVISLLLLLCAIGVCYDVLWKGLRQLGGSHYDARALLPILCIGGVGEAVFAMLGSRLPLSALISLELLCALWAEQRRDEAQRTAALLVRNAASLQGVKRVEQAFAGSAAALRGPADPEDFACMLDAEGPERAVMRIYAPLALVVSLLLGALGAVLGHVNFLWLWTALLLAATPLSCFVSYVLPYSLLTERLARKKAALCGWYGARVLSGCRALFLQDGELFPEGNLKLSGVKVFGSYQSAQVMGYASAILHSVGCAAAKLLQLPGEAPAPLHKLRAFDEGGYSAEIDHNTVLVGTMGFMKCMGVHRESGARVRQALYVSINGELAGLIALRYEPAPGVQKALKNLCGTDAPIPVLAGYDVLISPLLLRAKFRLPLERLISPPLRERMRYAGLTAGGEDLQGALVAKPGLEAVSAVCMGARSLVTAAHAGLILSVLGGIVGMIVIFLLGISDMMNLVNCGRLLAFALIWAGAALISSLSVLRK